MVLTGRLKLLLAAAIGVVIYVVATKPDEQAGEQPAPVERARARDSSPGAGQGSAAQGNPGQGRDAQGSAAKGASRNVSSAGSDEAARLYARLAHRVSDAPGAGALFKSTSWYTPPPPPPVVASAPVVVAPPAPVAPPIPFTIMGTYSRPGDSKVYFLTRGDRVFDVRIGDTIDSIYSVDRETGGQLQFTYKPLGTQQSLPVGGSQ